MKITKVEVIKEAQATLKDLGQKISVKNLTEIFETVVAAGLTKLAEAEENATVSLGSIKIEKKFVEEKEGRNPATGEAVTVLEHYKSSAKLVKSAKDMLRG